MSQSVTKQESASNSNSLLMTNCAVKNSDEGPGYLLIVIVQNGTETVINGTLSDVDLRNIDRYTITKSEDVEDRYLEYNRSVIKLFRK